MGGSCSNQYSFQVAALYPGGQVASQPTVPVRPCVVPGAPQNLGSAKDSHQVALSWSAPTNAAGSQITYDVSWSGATNGNRPVSGLSTTVTGLANGGTYTFTVTAVNAAGSGQAARVSVLLIGPTPTLGVHNLQGSNPPALFIRPGPSQSSGSPVGSIPQGGTVKILCQVKGGWVQDQSNPNLHGDIWDKVSNGYVSDLYVQTTNSDAGTWSYPQVWPCT
jgi:hypothetical protein